MKNKGLIILFIIFLGAIFLSLLITQQSQKTVSLFEKETSRTKQVENRILPIYPSQVKPTPVVRSPLVKSGVIISKASATESEEENIRASKISAEAGNNASSQNIPSRTEAQDSPQTGTTKIGKLPSAKEAQEMNSSGIVLY